MASFRDRGNGRVQIIIKHGKKPDGSPRCYYKEVDATSKRQLDKAAALFLAEIEAGEIEAGSSMTVDELWGKFITDYAAEVELSATTLAGYEKSYKNHIAPTFKKRKITSVTRSDVREWVKFLREDYINPRTKKSLAIKTVKNSAALLSSMFAYAMDGLEIINANPAVRMKVKTKAAYKKAEQLDNALYTESEIAELISALMEENELRPYNIHIPVILLILFTGMRTGEVMGLKWENVDFEKNHLLIDNCRSCASNGRIVEGTPKTGFSEREISVPKFIMDMFKNVKKYQTEALTAFPGAVHQGYVVSKEDGSPHHPSNTYKWFVSFLARKGMKKTTVHNLRHTHAAMLSHLGISLDDASHRLGHANPRITAERYWYLFKNVDDEISSELNSYYATSLHPEEH